MKTIGLQLGQTLRVLVMIVAMQISAPTLAEDLSEDKVKTVGGVLSINHDDPSGMHPLLLNKKKLLDIETDQSSLIKKFNVAGNDVILLSWATGGTCCPWKNYAFITITPSGSVAFSPALEKTISGQVLSGKIATAESDFPIFTQENAKITFSTVTLDGRRKKTTRWAYEEGNVKEVR